MHRSLAALLGLLALVAPSPALAGTLRVDILDIGQGDSILIRSPAGKTVLIDAGDGKVDVPPLLAKEGVTALDLVIGTHPHADHIGGMDDVVKALPIKAYTDNGLPHTTATYARLMADVESKGIAYRAAQSGQVYNLDDGAKLEVLFPNGTKLRDTRSDLNSNSVVVRLTHQGHCMLFVGDSEEPTEQALVAAGLGPCEILKVAHHGSRHSSTKAFLDTVKPKYAVISVGVGNRYRHPGRETIERLVAAGVDIHRTDLEGQLTILSSEKALTVKGAHAPLLPVTATPEETVAALGRPDLRVEGASGERDSVADGAEGARTAAVDVNAATAGDLEALPGVGKSTAANIVAYRTEHGAFASVDALDAVPGIGPSTLAKLRPLVRVGAASPSGAASPPPVTPAPVTPAPVTPAPRGSTSAPKAGASAPASGALDLNAATAEQLDALPGVGPATAAKILEYRAVHGGFGSVDELDAVSGIGPATMDKLRPLVRVGPAPAKAKE